MMAVEKFLSRKVSVTDNNGEAAVFPLSIVTIVVDDDSGCILDMQVEPYEKEIAGVIYTDNEISAVKQEDGSWVIRGIDRL